LRTGNRYTATIPVTIVRSEPAVTLAHECAPTDIARRETSNCTVTLQNNATDAAPVSMTATLSSRVRVDPDSVIGAELVGNQVQFSAELEGRTPPDVAIAEGATPAGYLPLSAFGFAPISGVGDETIANFDVDPFTYGGETYTRIGVVSNGYVVVGGGTGADVDFINQALPDATPPNNVLAPFWTDLNPSDGGAVRVGALTDGVDTWIVVDWAAVPNFSDSAATNTFQVWIPVENTPGPIGFAYGAVTNGDGGFLTVGAENADGNRGANAYVDGFGTAPVAGSELVVASTAGEPAPPTNISFDVVGRTPGAWSSRAEVQSPVIAGSNVVIVQGTVRAR
jgi:hypothetical protein